MATYKDLLHDKMNWKLINMLIDKFMRYEDIGNICCLDICVNNTDSDRYALNYITVYSYDTEHGVIQWETKAFFDRNKLIKLINKNGFEYKIVIYDSMDDNNNNYPNLTKMGEIRKILEATNKLVCVETDIHPFSQYKFKEKNG